MTERNEGREEWREERREGGRQREERKKIFGKMCLYLTYTNIFLIVIPKQFTVTTIYISLTLY
jgi:hypothetical protein